MKKTVGYGFKMCNESYSKAIGIYANGGGFLPNKEAVKKEIAKAKEDGDINKNTKPKIFKLVVEIK